METQKDSELPCILLLVTGPVLYTSQALQTLYSTHLKTWGCSVFLSPCLEFLNLFKALDYMSLVMRKPDFCICENKDADQLCRNRTADQRLCFATWIVQSLFFLNPKFQASSVFLSLHSPVCVGPCRKPRRPVFSERGSYMMSKCFTYICIYRPVMSQQPVYMHHSVE